MFATRCPEHTCGFLALGKVVDDGAQCCHLAFNNLHGWARWPVMAIEQMTGSLDSPKDVAQQLRSAADARSGDISVSEGLPVVR
jgi:hypothetical protein